MKHLLVVLLAGLLCCTGNRPVEEINIVSPHPPEIKKEFGAGFRAHYRAKTGRDITVNWLDVGGTGESIEYVKSRNKPGMATGGVDLFFGGGDMPFITLEKLGLLAPCHLPPEILSRMIHELNGLPLYHPDGLWYGAALSSFGILINKTAAARNHLALPLSWADLGTSDYEGWVSMGDLRYSGTLHVMAEIVLQVYGWDEGWRILLSMAANASGFPKGASSAAKDVGLGQAAFGLSIDFYALAEIERYGSDNLSLLLPEGATLVSPDGIGVLKNSPNPGAAQAFLEYVLSDGQKLWMQRSGTPGGPKGAAICRPSVDTTLYNLPDSIKAVTVNPYRLKNTFVFDSRLSGSRWALINDLFAAWAITPHKELKEARNAGVSLKPLMTESEAQALTAGWGKPAQAEKRVRLVNRWTNQARHYYDNR